MGRKSRAKKNKQKEEDSSLTLTSLTLDGCQDEEEEEEEEENLYTCEISPVFGRYLKSGSKTIPRGQIIMKEKFLLVGPMRSSQIVCVGCHSEFQSNRKPKKCRCSWPICSDRCSQSIFHADECEYFCKNDIKGPEYLFHERSNDFGAYAILRAILLKVKDPSGFEKLIQLESHDEVRKKLPIWRENEESVVRVLQEKWECSNLMKHTTSEEIHKICGILEVNSFELGEVFSFRGIFPRAAMMSHTCIPNASHYETPSTGEITVIAAKDIQPNTPINVTYAYSLEGTLERRSMLDDTKFFVCDCERCVTPDELGSNMSTYVCQECKIGDLLNLGASLNIQEWNCKNCSNRIGELQIYQLNKQFREISENIPNTIEAQESFIRECEKYFHPNHAIPFGVKFNLCQGYGRLEKPLVELNSVDLGRKKELCTQVLSVLNIVTPGYTVTRGLVLYELQAAELMEARRIFESGKYVKSVLIKKLQNALGILKESVEILLLSSESSGENKMAQSLKKSTLPELIKWISLLK